MPNFSSYHKLCVFGVVTIWESEIKIYSDKKTGRKIKKLTANHENIHFYFTENSFDINNNEIFFYSTRGSDEKLKKTGIPTKA